LTSVFARDPSSLTAITQCATGGGDAAFGFQVIRVEIPFRRTELADATSTRVPVVNDLAARLATFDLSHWQGADYWLLGTAFSSDGRRLAFSARERAALLWDIGSNEPPRTIPLRGFPRGLHFSPDGARLAIDAGTSLYVFQVDALELLVKWRVRNADEVFGSRVAWSPDGRLLARTNGSTTVRLYEAATGRETIAIGKKPGSLQCVAFSPDGLTLATGTLDGPVRVWDVE
jgi:WD40 repeat protein